MAGHSTQEPLAPGFREIIDPYERKAKFFPKHHKTVVYHKFDGQPYEVWVRDRSAHEGLQSGSPTERLLHLEREERTKKVRVLKTVRKNEYTKPSVFLREVYNMVLCKMNAEVCIVYPIKENGYSNLTYFLSRRFNISWR